MYLSDIRLKRTLADILHPSSKEFMNPRTFEYLSLVLRDKRKSCLFATFPKSGWNWTIDILSYCIIKHFTGVYDVSYLGSGTLKERERKPYTLFHPADSRTRGQRPIREHFPQLDIDFCFHTHGYWKESPLWSLDNSKTIFITRNIPSTLYSFYQSRGNKYGTFEEVLEEGVLDRLILFYNSWGKFCDTHSNFKIFKFEDFKDEPTKYFGALIDYVFNIGINDSLLEEACDYYDIEKQKQREFQFFDDANKHFHFEGSIDYAHKISTETLRTINYKVNNELQYQFGYRYPQ